MQDLGDDDGQAEKVSAHDFLLHSSNLLMSLARLAEAVVRSLDYLHGGDGASAALPVPGSVRGKPFGAETSSLRQSGRPCFVAGASEGGSLRERDLYTVPFRS